MKKYIFFFLSKTLIQRDLNSFFNSRTRMDARSARYMRKSNNLYHLTYYSTLVIRAAKLIASTRILFVGLAVGVLVTFNVVLSHRIHVIAQ